MQHIALRSPALMDDDRPLAGRSAAAALVPEPVVRQAAADTLRGELQRRGLHALLDPFGPVAERRRTVHAILRQAIARDREAGGPLARVADDAATLDGLYDATLGWGPAQRYLDDPQVNEVKIVGTAIRVQESGRPFVTVAERFVAGAEVVSRAQLLASLLGVTLDGAHPQATLPLSHGTRMHVSIPPRVAHGEVLVCIRRGRSAAWRVDDLLAHGTLDGPTAELLRLLCRARCSMLVIGRTGSGKTTLLEALANSWPGEPHIITIEDHTLEIGIRDGVAWTRELVDTGQDPRAFGLVAREALRQTPDLLVPGETRAQEAGAILSLILSDHPVLTTIHARDGADGLERFAACAALPGSYLYEGRRDDALRDACGGFDVAITVDLLAASGRRVVREIALAGGVQAAPGGLQARTIPLVRLAFGTDGAPVWQAEARALDGELVWRDGQDRTPRGLQARLDRSRAAGSLPVALPSQELVRRALREAERLIAGGRAARALEVLRDAWRARHDPALVLPAQAALAVLPALRAERGPELERCRDALDSALVAHRWPAARQALEAIRADLTLVTLGLPPDGWEPVAARIARGVGALEQTRQALATASELIQSGQTRQAHYELERLAATVDAGMWDLETEIAVDECRLAVLTALAAAGQAAPEALAAVAARLDGLRARRSHSAGLGATGGTR